MVGALALVAIAIGSGFAGQFALAIVATFGGVALAASASQAKSNTLQRGGCGGGCGGGGICSGSQGGGSDGGSGGDGGGGCGGGGD